MHARRWAGRSVLAVAVLAAAGAFLPLPPRVLSNQVDEAFARTLHFGAAHGYTSGSELISTFGPLGFAFYATYFPATFFWLVALRVALGAATVWTLAWIGYAAWGSPWGAAVALLTCVPFLAPPDVWFIVLPLLAVFVELPVSRAAPASLRITLGAAIGLACLIKFTALISALAVLGPLTSALLLARRRPLLSSAALVAAGIAWVVTGHTPADALRYVDWSGREISAGYAGAMQLFRDRNLLLHAAAVSLATLVAGVLCVRRRLAAGRWAAVSALAAVTFLLFKAGFVRADVHVFTPVFGLMVVALLLVLSWGRRPIELALGALLVALLAGGLWAHAAALRGWPTLYFPPVFPAQALGRLASLSLLWQEDVLASEHARDEAGMREQYPLPRLEGTVDVYPYDQTVVLAHALDLRPRPVFQSYMAYTPRLARANAEHLSGELAPDWIVFRVAPIDLRLPALDDAASWPLFLTHYRVHKRAGMFALLRRRDAPRRFQLESLGTVESTMGTQVEVPSVAGPIWVRVDLHQTSSDALLGVLVAPRMVFLAVGRRKGKAEAFRFVPELGRGGFLLSPLVEDTGDFMQLMEAPGRKSTNDVVWLKLRHAAGTEPSRRALTVEFSRLSIEE